MLGIVKPVETTCKILLCQKELLLQKVTVFVCDFNDILKIWGRNSVETTDRHCFSKRIIVQSKSQIFLFIQPLFETMMSCSVIDHLLRVKYFL